jgi:uncharacterized protein (TIGR02271 family)
MKRTITAMFDRYQDAVEAVRKLESAGIPHSDISIVSNDPANRDRLNKASGPSTAARRSDATDGDDAATGAGTGASMGALLGGGAGLLAGLGMLAIPGLGPVVAAGWLASTLVGAGAGAATGGLVGALTGAGIDEADAHTYAEGIRRGGTLVTVRAEEAQSSRVIDILDDEGTVNLDHREATWRKEGWTGRYAPDHNTGVTGAARDAGAGIAGAASRAADKLGDAAHAAGSALGVTGDRRPAAAGPGSTARTGLVGSDSEERIPIAEEQLSVGKREVNQGRVRVRSYVVETPVQEQVNLREEHVSVERRPVDRPVSGSDALFQDRTIEATEKTEQAVVSKQARVKEELVIKKDVDQKTETVSDTVRRTEVKVEDERDTAGSKARKPV